MKTRIKPGEFGRAHMPFSEVCMFMKIANAVFDFLLKDNGMVQLLKDGRPFGGAITTGEAGIYHDADGYWYDPSNKIVD